MKINKKIPLLLIILILLISLPAQVFALTYTFNPIPLDTGGIVGYETSMIIVNGYPAISYTNANNGTLKFIRALDASGTSWGPDQNLGHVHYDSDTSMAIVNGRPAIAYYDNDGGEQSVRFLRANDENGSSWPSTPVKVNGENTITHSLSLAVVNGYPAISYYAVNNRDLIYVRATSADGSTWGAPITVESDGDVGSYNTLLIVDGNPAIGYRRADELRFIRANNANGSDWPASGTIVDSVNDVGLYASMALVNGNPAFSYKDETNNQLKYIRANDAIGSDWTTPARTLDGTGYYNQDTSLAVINGKPAISYYDGMSETLNFIQATDADGTNWSSLVELDSGRYVGRFPSMIEVNDHVGVSYLDDVNDDLKYVMVETVDMAIYDGARRINNNEYINFGTTTVGNPITRTLTIVNNGTTTLDITRLTLPSSYYSMAGGEFIDEIPSGGSVDINIRLDAIQRHVAYTQDLEFRSNDTNLSPFSIRIIGETLTARGEISVFDGTTEITDGTGSFDYGSTTVGTPISHTFTVENTSTEDLKSSIHSVCPAGSVCKERIIVPFPLVVPPRSPYAWTRYPSAPTADSFPWAITITTRIHTISPSAVKYWIPAVKSPFWMVTPGSPMTPSLPWILAIQLLAIQYRAPLPFKIWGSMIWIYTP